MKPKRTSLETVQEVAQELADLLQELIDNEDDRTSKAMLLSMHKATKTTIDRAEGLITLRDFRGYKFAVIDPTTGEVRKASREEAERIALHFPPAGAGGAVEILKKYYDAQRKAEEQGTTPPDPNSWDWLDA